MVGEMNSIHTFTLWLLVLLSPTHSTLQASYRQDKRLSETSIAIAELAFEDVRIRPSALDGYEFVGRIRNASTKYTLHSVAIRIVFYDCAQRSDDSTCKPIGERQETIYTAIPPGEEGAFKEPIYIYGDVLKVRGDFVWRYEVLATTAGQ